MRKILLVANTGWYLYNFRLPLARFLRGHRIEPVMVSPRDAYVDRIQAEGFRWIELRMNRRSLNPLRECCAIIELVRLYRRERPAAVHHFTAKCVLYGTVAAKLSGVRAVVNAVTGLGHVFLGTGPRARILRPLLKSGYRCILTARRVRVVFQNPDDLQAFLDSDLVVPDRTVLIRSSGVNLLRFSPRPGLPDSPLVPVVLLAARLLHEKGVCDFVEAARRLKQDGVEAVFQIAGEPDPANPSSISPATLEAWKREGAVDLLGHVDPIDEIIAQATLVVLPSYREGTPRILLEAAAMGKPIVATDVPGCREAVVHEENGLLVPVRDPAALAAAIRRLLEDGVLRRRMGQDGRRKMEREFSDVDIARQTAEVYRIMGAFPQSHS